MTDWFARPLLDLHAVDLDSAPRVEYLLCQRFRYEYDAPAFDVRQRIVAVPRKRHGSLHLRAHHVDVAVTGARRVVRDGAASIAAATPSWTCTSQRSAAPWSSPSPPSCTATARSATRACRPRRCAIRPTSGRPRSTRADHALQAVAAEVRAAAADDVEFAEMACAVVKAGIEYGFGATSVETTAAEAWAIGRGVCQDSAHVLLAICRAAGVPARYVSGHLLGQLGGSHAWVEVLVPDGSCGARARRRPVERMPCRPPPPACRRRARLRRRGADVGVVPRRGERPS